MLHLRCSVGLVQSHSAAFSTTSWELRGFNSAALTLGCYQENVAALVDGFVVCCKGWQFLQEQGNTRCPGKNSTCKNPVWPYGNAIYPMDGAEEYLGWFAV